MILKEKHRSTHIWKQTECKGIMMVSERKGKIKKKYRTTQKIL